jgi:signal transduction histidine kinase
LLARRVVARLERLGRAAEALAGGDLRSRVEEGPADEVGQLTRRFNRMADRLAETVDELEGQRQRAESLLRAKRDLVANVSHELRTPLASIRGHTESLLMEDLEDGAERRHRYLDVIHRETERLNRLIGDLFDLSTAEVGALPLTLQPVSLGDVVAEVAESFRPIARRERQITLVSTIEPDLPSAWADRARVVQILSNLLRNALRHTPEGGLVSIRVERDADFVRTTVEDTGVGIAPEHLARVFERFYRGDNARDRASGGVGLGLAIVRELVEAMDGTVHAASTIGEGSRFSFALPLASEPASPTPGRQVTTAS